MDNEKDVFTEYAVIKARIKELNAQLDQLKPAVISKVREYEGDSVKVGFGTFFVKSVKRFVKYSTEVEDMRVELKQKMKIEEESGLAVARETEELVFRFSQLDDGTIRKHME